MKVINLSARTLLVQRKGNPTEQSICRGELSRNVKFNFIKINKNKMCMLINQSKREYNLADITKCTLFLYE